MKKSPFLMIAISIVSLLLIVQRTESAVMKISEAGPRDGSSIVSLNPVLSARVTHNKNNMMTLVFSIREQEGEWTRVKSYENVEGGFYSARTKNVRRRNTAWQWKLEVTDGDENISKEFSFEVVDYIGEMSAVVARGTCFKYGYIRRGSKPGRFYLGTQAEYGKGGAAYDIDMGWYDTMFEIPYLGHPSWGYWDSKYHIIGNVGQGPGSAWHIGKVSSESFESFSEMDTVRHARKIGRLQKNDLPETSTYTFNNGRAWIMTIEYNEESKRGDLFYREWTKENEKAGIGYRDFGWAPPVLIGTTVSQTGTVGLLRTDRNRWYVYLVEGEKPESSHATLKYFKSEDAGKTWSELQDTGIPANATCSHPSFARYGNNYYVFITDDNNVLAYYSRDGENWNEDSRVLIAGGFTATGWNWPLKAHGTLLHQGALISTFTDPKGWGYEADQYARITLVNEMLSSPGIPVNVYPEHMEVLKVGTREVILKAEVKGPQTYDVAFYRGDGTFIGLDRLLKDGDTAQIALSGLEAGGTYRWYAVSRGATAEYYGEPDSTSDEAWSEVFAFTVSE